MYTSSSTSKFLHLRCGYRATGRSVRVHSPVNIPISGTQATTKSTLKAALDRAHKILELKIAKIVSMRTLVSSFLF